jgi:predicted aspartyl protease
VKRSVAVAALCAALSACATSASDPDKPDQAATVVAPTELPAIVAPIEPSAGVNEVRVPLKRDGGLFMAPVTINKSVTLNFTVDSGAADVTIPADVVSALVRSGAVAESDFIGRKTYLLADGSTVPSAVLMLRSLTVGGLTVENVRAGETPARGSLLLGQTFLARFKSWSFDNARRELVLR